MSQSQGGIRWKLVVVVLLITMVANGAAALATDVGILHTTYFSDGNGYIRNLNNGYVELSGYSSANQAVDQIWVTLYLQKLDGSRWVTVSSGTKFNAYNDDYASGSKSIPVAAGTYRTMAQHQLQESGVYEPVPPYTSYSTSIKVS